MAKIILICVGLLYFLIYFLLSSKTGKPFKTIIFHGFLGITCMAIIDLTSPFSGIFIPINGYSLGCSAALGLPGVVGLLVLKLIFM